MLTPTLPSPRPRRVQSGRPCTRSAQARRRRHQRPGGKVLPRRTRRSARPGRGCVHGQWTHAHTLSSSDGGSASRQCARHDDDRETPQGEQATRARARPGPHRFDFWAGGGRRAGGRQARRPAWQELSPLASPHLSSRSSTSGSTDPNTLDPSDVRTPPFACPPRSSPVADLVTRRTTAAPAHPIRRTPVPSPPPPSSCPP